MGVRRHSADGRAHACVAADHSAPHHGSPHQAELHTTAHGPLPSRGRDPHAEEWSLGQARRFPSGRQCADECGGLVRVQFKRTWSVPDYDEPCARRLLRRYWRHVQSRRPSKSAALRSDRCHLLPSRRSVNKAWASIRHILCGGLQRRKSAHFGTVRSGTPSLACACLHPRVQIWLVAALTSVCDGWPLSRASFLAPTVTALWGGRSRCLTLAELAWLAPTSNSHGS